MDERIVKFVAALRAAGVRISLAESEDAFFAMRSVGVANRPVFKGALKTSLVKDHKDEDLFEALFPLYFQVGTPPYMPASDALSSEEMEMLRAALQALAGQIGELLSQLAEGQGPSDQELQNTLDQTGMSAAGNLRDQRWLEHQMRQQMGIGELTEEIQRLLDALESMGMSEEALRDLQAILEANAANVNKQISQQVGAGIAQKMAQKNPNQEIEDLLDRPFERLSPNESERLRSEVTRLAAILRTRAALRQKRGKGRQFDAKSTLRANVRYGGVPFEVIHKVNRRKARFTVLCDVSTSMRPVVSFLLLMLYQIQDQVSRTRSFAYINRMEEISQDLADERPEVAIPKVLQKISPGHYNTDLGSSLEVFSNQFLDSVDGRTTIILCGDGRNNYNNPRVDLIDELLRRSQKFVWFTPEHRHIWGTGDSDMPSYAQHVEDIYHVSNLRQLSRAVDDIFVG